MSSEPFRSAACERQLVRYLFENTFLVSDSWTWRS